MKKKLGKKQEKYFTKRLKDKVVYVNDCWLWKGASTYGIPMIWDYDRTRNLRHVMWARSKPGETIPFNIGTSCGNESCVNPNHLIPIEK